MASRETILAALRAASAPPAPLPAGWDGAARHADPAARLAVAVAAVGGALVRVPRAEDLPAEVAALAGRVGARRVASVAPGAGPGTIDLAALTDSHQLEGLDLAVLPGAFAVAETGAVWVAGEALPLRALFVIPEHLALVVSAGDLVNDMHEAYARLRFQGPGFGVFISGPSKTADIEQALVIGAHGARSCTVFLVGGG
jgi:L-lactate dehydrogenase complex protein LldG